MKSFLTREGIYYLFVILVVLIGSILREVNLMLLLTAFLCAPFIIAWRLGRFSLCGITVRRQLPQRVFAGEPFAVQLEVAKSQTPSKRKRKFLSCWGLVVIDRILPLRINGNETGTGKCYEPAVYFEYVPANQGKKKSYYGKLPQRGRYRVGPAKAETRFPFGMFRHILELTAGNSDTSELCVYPQLGKLLPKWKLRQHAAAESRQRNQYRPSRVTGEFLGVRRWQQGDVQKWIHWRASAKHNEPVVRQFEQHQNRDSAVLIDLYHTGELDAVQYENFELAVSFTATLISEVSKRNGCNLFFAVNPKDDYLYGKICLPLIDDALYRLAVAEPAAEDRLAQLLLKAVSQGNADAELILVVPKPVDLNYSPRFQSVQNDPRFRAVLQRIRVVDTSSEELEQIFAVQ
ncbi:MAG: DUF58 domain-containing protein [Planctomycetaceae bacterium]|jgi:uncharacterized protein (DUF58 family)|nr:DUF58 domain-containing protein [Planctomycetaceae bacterium]